MTREELERRTKVQSAYLAGMPIQVRFLNDYDRKWEETTNPGFDWDHCDYRVKEATIRPFTLMELLYYIADHLDATRHLIHKDTGTKEYLFALDPYAESGLVIETKTGWLTLEQLADSYTFADGTPCGIPTNE